MYKLLLIVIGICLSGKMFVSAQQWTKKDSIWLKKVLSGKEKLELNPEAKKAIESGELINLEEPASHMKLAPTEKLPVTQDFSEYIRPDTIKRKVALKQLPPAVFGSTILPEVLNSEFTNTCWKPGKKIRCPNMTMGISNWM